jgi:leucyl/phenylalanyl-tRNA--protein transferase
LGALEVEREEFLGSLQLLKDKPVNDACFENQWLEDMP